MADGLVDRLRAFNEKVQSIAALSAKGELSPEGTSNALALLVSLNAKLFIQIELALDKAALTGENKG